jgi:hypothetical protein
VLSGQMSAPSPQRAFGKPYVTRLPEEKYLDACCVPKFKSSSSWTIHGSISAFGKGDLVIFEEEWDRITGTVYREHVLPFVYRFMERVAGHPENPRVERCAQDDLACKFS